MLRSVQQTNGLDVQSVDGPIGDIDDVYFDDHNWIVRYFIVDTGEWLPGRKVLIPPHVVRQMADVQDVFPVDLTREQVRNSPEIDMERPVDRQAELVLYQHYGWTPYWFPLEPAGGLFPEGDAEDRERHVTSGHSGGDPHLRSALNVIGYHMGAIDGEVGHVADFLFDDESFEIRHVIVDTSNWFGGKKVLISPEWITEVKWSESKVFVKVSRDSVKRSPEYKAMSAAR